MSLGAVDHDEHALTIVFSINSSLREAYKEAWQKLVEKSVVPLRIVMEPILTPFLSTRTERRQANASKFSGLVAELERLAGLTFPFWSLRL